MKQVTSAKDKIHVKSLLEEVYRTYSLVHYDSLFLQENYFVIEENGKFIAGVQAHEAHWIFKHMSGFAGKIALDILPHIPIMNRLFNAKNFQFVTFEHFYCADGRIDALLSLMEAVLQHFKRNSSFIWLDEKSSFYSMLNNSGKMGLFHQFAKDSDLYKMVSFKDVDNETEDFIRNSPMMTSSYDYS